MLLCDVKVLSCISTTMQFTETAVMLYTTIPVGMTSSLVQNAKVCLFVFNVAQANRDINKMRQNIGFNLSLRPSQ